MKVTVVLTSPIYHHHSAMPKALHDLYYLGNDSGSLLKMGLETSGSPHHGGEHTLSVWGQHDDVLAWLDLFKEQYPDTELEIAILKNRIETYLKHHPQATTFRIVLKDIIRQYSYKGDIIARAWYWNPEWEKVA